jgi:hypothetical protein
MQIFIEHESHRKFIQALVKAKYTRTLPDKLFIKLNDRGEIPYVKNEFIIHTDANGINLLLLNNTLGIQSEQAGLATLKRKYGIQFDCFFFPDNSSKGTLEDLLYDIIPNQHIEFKDYFSKYSKELNASAEYNEPSGKCKVYAYLDAVASDIEEHHDYTDPNRWDIHHNQLQPIINFANIYFQGRYSLD